MGGALLDNEFVSCKGVCPSLNTWVESGTYKGESSRRAAAHFQHIFTFEVDLRLHAEAKASAVAAGLDSSGYWLGDSPDLLTRYLTMILPEQPETTQVLFFLDAHLSGVDSGHNGKEAVPLLRELDAINRWYPSDRPALLCVDDVRLFGAFEDWMGISLTSIREALTRHRVCASDAINDRLYILLNQTQSQ